MNTNIKKWYTLNEYVDITTGEVLTSKNALADYTIIKKHKNTEINEKMATAVIRYLNECKPKPSKQGTIFQ